MGLHFSRGKEWEEENNWMWVERITIRRAVYRWWWVPEPPISSDVSWVTPRKMHINQERVTFWPKSKLLCWIHSCYVAVILTEKVILVILWYYQALNSLDIPVRSSALPALPWQKQPLTSASTDSSHRGVPAMKALGQDFSQWKQAQNKAKFISGCAKEKSSKLTNHVFKNYH